MSDRVKAVAPPDGRTTESVCPEDPKSETEAPREPAPVSVKSKPMSLKRWLGCRKTLCQRAYPQRREWRKRGCARYRKLMDGSEDAIAAAPPRSGSQSVQHTSLIATTSAEAKYAAGAQVDAAPHLLLGVPQLPGYGGWVRAIWHRC